MYFGVIYCYKNNRFISFQFYTVDKKLKGKNSETISKYYGVHPTVVPVYNENAGIQPIENR